MTISITKDRVDIDFTGIMYQNERLAIMEKAVELSRTMNGSEHLEISGALDDGRVTINKE